MEVGEYWPITTNILRDESLSSWIKRLGLLYHTDFSHIYPTKNFKEQSDIDLEPNYGKVRRLSEGSGIDYDRFMKSTFHYYFSRLPQFTHELFGRPASEYVAGKKPCTSPIRKSGVHASSHFRFRFFTHYNSDSHYERYQNSFRFCPICLKSDILPYFRLFWRLSYYFVCIKHEVLLLNKCATCNKPILLYSQLKMEQCYNCNEKLYDAPTLKIKGDSIRKLHKLFVAKTTYHRVSSVKILELVWSIFALNMNRAKFYENIKNVHGEKDFSLWLKFIAFDELLKGVFKPKNLTPNLVQRITLEWSRLYD